MKRAVGLRSNDTCVVGDSGGRTRHGTVIWLLECVNCGSGFKATRGDVLRKSVECGCDAEYEVRDTERPEYVVWAGMKQRCCNPNNVSYHRYGGRGIFICKEWADSFQQFFKDMGERPNKRHSIERKDNNDGYHPSNCKWATVAEQAKNRRPQSKHKLPEGVVEVNGVYQARPVIRGAKLFLGTFNNCKLAKDAIAHMERWEGWLDPAKSKRGGSSPYKGVGFDKSKGKWKAYVPKNGKFLKLCETEEQARIVVENYFSLRAEDAGGE